ERHTIGDPLARQPTHTILRTVTPPVYELASRKKGPTVVVQRRNHHELFSAVCLRPISARRAQSLVRPRVRVQRPDDGALYIGNERRASTGGDVDLIERLIGPRSEHIPAHDLATAAIVNPASCGSAARRWSSRSASGRRARRRRNVGPRARR